jgi:alkanesulfonate monooxygenase SsuD/methylene tetrahydromethanopterin reductase-like flavin-dependent oxidoreductase (luciferase family)
MPRKLTFGYLYDFRNPPPWRRPWADLYAETLDFITWTESLGFAGAWVPEHHGADDGYAPSPLVILAAIAARTKTLKLGSAVALAPLYHPVRFAEDCALLDILSGGRAEMALAIGYRRREAEALGVDFSSRGRRTDEFIEIVRRLWSGETVSYAGRHFTLKNASIAPAPTRPIPLYLGGFREKALARAAKYGDGYFGNPEVWELYREQLQACGKDPATARMRIQGLFVLVARDPEQAMEELGPHFHYVNNAYARWLREDSGSTGFDDTQLKPMTLEEFKASRILRILRPGEAIDMLQEMRAKAPVEHFMLMLPPGIAPSKFAPYAELFAREVIPAFS